MDASLLYFRLHVLLYRPLIVCRKCLHNILIEEPISIAKMSFALPGCSFPFFGKNFFSDHLENHVDKYEPMKV